MYKGTHGVLLMFDLTKRWSFDYVLKMIPTIPETIPILVLGNHRDRAESRVILPDEITELVEAHQARTSLLKYAESSMSNGFGLKFIHRFFSVPYLTLHVRPSPLSPVYFLDLICCSNKRGKP